MKITKRILTLFAAFALCSTMGVVAACKDETDSQTANLVDFTDGVTSVEIGSRYVPDYLSVKDENGKEYDLVIRAYNAKEEEIGSTDGGFQVTEFSGYTVKYFAKVNGTEEVREVKVNVTDHTAPELKILNLRTEREVGTIAYPQVYVSDNSGEKLSYTIDAEAVDNTDANAFIKGEDSVTFNKPGTYKFVATATDSHGNVGRVEKEVLITASMGENVWEDFSNANHMETVKNTTFLTSMTEARWLSEFEGAQGVAMIQPNYARYYNNNFFVQLGLPKTAAEILACDWGTFTIRMYLEVKNAPSITLSNGDGFVFGEYPTKEWIDLVVDRKAYLDKSNNYMFPGFLGNEDYDARAEAFAQAVTQEIPRPMFSVSVGRLLDSIELSDVKIYIDGITWQSLGPDVTAPSVTLRGAFWQVLANSKMTLPTIVVEDDRDNNPKYEATFYKVGESGDVKIPIVANKVDIGDPGQYKLVVSATDNAGNHVEKEFIFTAAEEVDYTQISNYDNAGELGILGLLKGNGISWTESYTDKDGVTKEGLMRFEFSGNAGAEVVTLTLPQTTSDAMRDAMFDYVEFTFCVANERDSYGGSYGGYTLYSMNKSIPAYGQSTSLHCNKWYTLKFTLEELAKRGSYLSDTSTFTVERARNEFLSYYANNGLFFHTSDWFGGQTVVMYIDAIWWGVYEPDADAPEIKANGTWKSQIGNEYTLPEFTAIDERDGVIDVESVTVCKEGSDQVLTVTDGKITFTEQGRYVIKVTAVDAAGNRAEKEFIVTVVEAIDEKVIASYDSESELGVIGLVKTKDGVSYAESYTDKDGVTKEGLMKLTFNGDNGADAANMVISDEMLAKMREANFDYIELVVCVDNDDSYGGAYGGWSLYSFNTSIPDYRTNPLQCKKWETVRFSLSDLAAAGSYLSDTAQLTEAQAREAFLDYYSGASKAEHLLFNLSSWFERQTVTLYIDSITWGVNEA